MTWGKAAPVVIVAVVFDSLKFFFEQLWIFGPLLAGTAAGAVVGSWLGSWAGTAAGVAVTAVAGFFGAGAFELFGIVFGMAIGFLGWLSVAFLMFLTNARIFLRYPTSWLWLALGLGISEIPFIGSLPALTATVIKLYRKQIAHDHAALKKYEEERAEIERREREEAVAALLAAHAEAANDAAYELSEEIPEEERAAA